jgi:7-carboxy-7-deazaguanine synthase
MPFDNPAQTQSEPASSRLESRLRLLRNVPAGHLFIHEIYRSIQGESTHAGLPCVFVRLAVCQLRCSYCDTPHAFHSGSNLSRTEVRARTLALCQPGDLIEITGGEPLLQPEVLPLMRDLADSGHLILLETSGSVDVAPVDPRVRVILDIKTPGSGEAAANHWPNIDRLKPTDEVKFVIDSRADWEWSLQIIREYELCRRCPVLISPAFGQVLLPELARWILDSGLPLRLQIQLHKLIWNPSARGV